MKRKLSDADIELIADLREAGKTLPKIATAIGCSTSTVSWHCTKAGIASSKGAKLLRNSGPKEVQRGGHVLRRFSEEDDRAIRTMRIAGKSLNEIGRAIGRRHHSILGRLHTLARREGYADGEA